MRSQRLKKIAEDIGRILPKLSAIEKQADEIGAALLNTMLDILRLYHGIDAPECCGVKGGKHDAN